MLIFFSPGFVCVKATEQAKEEVKRVLAFLNQHLNTRTFLVGERVSLADITVVCSLLWLYKQVSFIKISFFIYLKKVAFIFSVSVKNVCFSIRC